MTLSSCPLQASSLFSRGDVSGVTSEFARLLTLRQAREAIVAPRKEQRGGHGSNRYLVDLVVFLSMEKLESVEGDDVGCGVVVVSTAPDSRDEIWRTPKPNPASGAPRRQLMTLTAKQGDSGEEAGVSNPPPHYVGLGQLIAVSAGSSPPDKWRRRRQLPHSSGTRTRLSCAALVLPSPSGPCFVPPPPPKGQPELGCNFDHSLNTLTTPAIPSSSRVFVPSWPLNPAHAASAPAEPTDRHRHTPCTRENIKRTAASPRRRVTMFDIFAKILSCVINPGPLPAVSH